MDTTFDTSLITDPMTEEVKRRAQAQAKALRGQQQMGYLGQLSGDRVLSPLGSELVQQSQQGLSSLQGLPFTRQKYRQGEADTALAEGKAHDYAEANTDAAKAAARALYGEVYKAEMPGVEKAINEHTPLDVLKTTSPQVQRFGSTAQNNATKEEIARMVAQQRAAHEQTLRALAGTKDVTKQLEIITRGGTAAYLDPQTHQIVFGYPPGTAPAPTPAAQAATATPGGIAPAVHTDTPVAPPTEDPAASLQEISQPSVETVQGSDATPRGNPALPPIDTQRVPLKGYTDAAVAAVVPPPGVKSPRLPGGLPGAVGRPQLTPVAQARADKAAAGAGLSFTPEAVDQAAHVFAKTGTLPQLSRGQAGANEKARVINRAAEMYPLYDLTSLRSGIKTDTTSLSKLKTQADAVNAFEGAAGRNLDNFLAAAGSIPDTGIPLFNMPARTFAEKVSGDPAMSRFNVLRQTAAVEVGKVLSGAMGAAAVSDSARHEVNTLLSPDATVRQQIAAAKAIRQDMESRKVAFASQIAEIGNRIQGAGVPQGAAPGAPAPKPASVPVRYKISPDRKWRAPISAAGEVGPVEPNPNG